MSQSKRRRRIYKHKLLLDEGFHLRTRFPLLNNRFDLKHIKVDLHLTSLADREVYQVAVKQNRLVVTFNEKDFRYLVNKKSGIIAVSATLSFFQIEKKIMALLHRSTRSQLLGKVTEITGETKK